MYDYQPYKLPTIEFVGGEQQDLEFWLYDETHEAFDLTGYTAEFAIQDYTNHYGETLLSKSMTLVYSSGFPVAISVSLSPSETIGLSGKYIYQIMIRDSGDLPQLIPSQGAMYITYNINDSLRS